MTMNTLALDSLNKSFMWFAVGYFVASIVHYFIILLHRCCQKKNEEDKKNGKSM